MALAQVGEQQRAGTGTSFNRIMDLSLVGGLRNGLKCPCREGACAVQAWAYLSDTAPNLVKRDVHGYCGQPVNLSGQREYEQGVAGVGPANLGGQFRGNQG